MTSRPEYHAATDADRQLGSHAARRRIVRTRMGAVASEAQTPSEPGLWLEGAGDPLLFLHGWGLSPAAYAPSLRQLAERGFTVAAPQLAVLGRSWSPSSAIARIRFSLDRLGWERAVVVGNSLGGALALLLAATEPQRVRLLVLVDSVGLRVDQPSLEFGWPWSLAHYATAGHLRALAAFLTNVAHPARLVNLLGAAHFALRANLEGEVAAALAAGVCSVVLWGERDRLLPLSHAELLAAGLDAHLHVVGDADHDWTVRDPLGFAEVLEDSIRGRLANEPLCADPQRDVA